METLNTVPESFDESKSLQVIREMIGVSQKKLQNDGILFILWGWLMFYNYISSYFLREFVLTYPIKKTFDYAGYVIAILAIGFSLFYILKQSKKVQTYIGISLRYVWISLIGCLILTSLIIHNILHVANFELQHPIFMMFIAFATIVTGGIMRYKLTLIGGVAFAILAYVSSYFKLPEQILLEAAAWLIAFIIPGHILYAQRKK